MNLKPATYYFSIDKVKTQDVGYLIGALDGGVVYFFGGRIFEVWRKNSTHWRQFFRPLSYFSPKNVLIPP